MQCAYQKAVSRLMKLRPTFLQPTQRLQNLRTILAQFGNPHLLPNKYVHVTGTNGKGSVSMKIAKALQLSGYRTGLFTSPHLFAYTQRLKIDGIPVTRELFVQTFEKIEPYIQQYNLNYFQVATLMGFVYFQTQNCDKIVLEVGLGAKYDPTNIISQPLVSVVTSIGMDHAHLLGDTLQSIAENKAEIIKTNRPVVIGPYCFPQKVFRRKAEQQGSSFHQVSPASESNFQAQHDLIVSKVIQLLRRQPGIVIPQSARQGSLQARQECRREYVATQRLPQENRKRNNKVVLDVGHNPPALQKLFQTLRVHHPKERFTIIYGTSGHKDSLTSTNVLKQFSDKVYLIEANHFKAMHITQLKRNAMGIEGVEVVEDGDIPATIKQVLKSSCQDDVVVICGSFFIMCEVKGHFYPEEIKSRMDPPTI